MSSLSVIVARVVFVGDVTSWLHSHRDWTMCLFIVRKFVKLKGSVFRVILALCVNTLMPNQ